MAPAQTALWLWEVRVEKRTLASASLSIWEKAVPQLSPGCQTRQCLTVYHWCLSICYPSARAHGEWVSKPMCGFFKRNCLGLWKFLPPTQSALVIVARSYGDLSSCTGTLGWGVWCGAGTPCSQDIPPEFSSTTCGGGTSPFHISTPPTSWIDVVSFIPNCWTSIQLNSWHFWMMADLYFSCNFDVVVQGGEPCLHMVKFRKSSRIFLNSGNPQEPGKRNHIWKTYQQ